MSNKQKPTKRQHYVPQWYLRLFSNENGFVYVGDLGKWVSPDTIFFGKWLYELDGIPKNEMEHILRDVVESVDSQFIYDFISRLDGISDPARFVLSDDEKLGLYKFMMSMACRHPDSFSNYESAGADLAEASKNMICQLGFSDNVAKCLCNFVTVNGAVQTIRNYQFGKYRDELYTIDVVQRYGVAIFKATGDVHFVTSNRPVCIFCDGNFRIMPLSPKYAVAFMSLDMLPVDAPMHYFNPILDEHVLGLQRFMYHNWSPRIISNSKDLYDLIKFEVI